MLARAQTLLLSLAAAGALWFGFSFIAVALLSAFYPYPLEWMEGHSIDIIQRVMEGKSIYVEPTLEYVPFIYMPLYFYVSAAFGHIAGLDFHTGRLVSFSSAMGTGILLYHWVRKEGGERKTALIAPGLFYATYTLSARWFDVARIDSLYIFLLTATLFVFVHYRSMGACFLAALFATAAFFTKQNTLIVLTPVLLMSLRLIPRNTMLFMILFIMWSGCILIGMHVLSDGWAYYYLFDIPASHAVDERNIIGFWRDDLLKNLAPAMLLCFAGWVALFRKDKRKAFLYLALAAGLVGAAYAGRLHRFGWTNVLISAHLALALFSTLALVHWIKQHRPKWAVSALALILAQFGILLYNPVLLIPTAESQRQGDAFLEEIRAIDGEVFMPEIQFISTRIGKTSYAYGFAAIDVLQSDTKTKRDAKNKLRGELINAMRSQRFSAVVSTGLVSRHYMKDRYIAAKPLIFPSEYVSGYQPREPWLFVPMQLYESTPP